MIINKPKKKKKFSRYSFFTLLISIVAIIFGAKLVYLQIYKHADYVDQANTTGTKFVSEKAPRGKIYDENGNILATNRQTYSLTYTSTDDADSSFYSTIDSVVSILNSNNETIQDDLILSLNTSNQWYMNYTSTGTDAQNTEDVRFKRDRGLNEVVEKELKTDGVIDKDTTDYSDDQINMINQKLLEISPTEVFYYLVKSYDLIDLVDPSPSKEQASAYKEMSGEDLANILLQKYSLADLRKYILFKDAIKMQSFKGYKTVTIAKNINQNTAFIIYQKLNDLPGIDVTLEPTRYYPYKNLLASSVLGYIAPIDTSNKDKYELKGYDSTTDLIGVSGIESAFEEQLKGVKGGTTVKVNSKGRTTEELFKLESYPGNDVHLTLDKNVQYAAEQSLIDTMANLRSGNDNGAGIYAGATRGAVVAVEVDTGRILACASYPNYDPNMFAISGKLTPEQNEQYFSPDLGKFGAEYIKSRGLSLSVDDLFPVVNGVRTDKYDIYPKSFFNYATQGIVPPGSTFKPITAIAGLESGVITPSTTIEDKIYFREHPETYGTSFAPKSAGNGVVDVSKALEVSCNYYFYEVAYRLYKNAGSDVKALDALAEYAWKFGLGTDPNSTQKKGTGIEIEENSGQVYNFESAKQSTIYYSRFQLSNYLESGNYESRAFYVPFDYASNEGDSEKLAAAKQSLKDKISARFQKVGEGDNSLDYDEFKNSIIGDVKDIMNYSEKYAQNMQNYQASKNVSVDKDTQANIIADTIAKFVINDKRSEMISPAQQVIAAIGQGTNTFTPMQLAQYVSTIANGGTRYSLHFVDSITSPDGKVLQQFNPIVLDKATLQPSTLAAVKSGMSKVNEDEGGTAVAAFTNFPIKTAGKTGTADIDQDNQTSWGRAPYANYISFAPFDNPKIAIAAVVYDGGHGGNIAPIARAVYEAYFKNELLQQDPSYASKSESFQKYVLNAPADVKDTVNATSTPK